MYRLTARRLLGRKDFDAWAYSIDWPQNRRTSPLSGTVNLSVEDIKFAYNAWSLLRLAMFYGLGHPKILSDLTNTTPSMDIARGGNRLFYLHSRVGEPLAPRSLKVALTPDHPNAVTIQRFPWQKAVCEALVHPDSQGVEIVLGMENGLSESVVADCDHCVYIAQYGSIGSLSMMSALAIAAHMAVTAGTSAAAATPVLALEATPTKGHMPQSNHNEKLVSPRPHETDLLNMSNDDIVELLRWRRTTYALQLSVMMYNDFGDRNIGAVMRNANAFNCEEMIILNRRRFNRRGAVGTNHLLKTSFLPSTAAPGFADIGDEYEVWLLYQYYPYLELYDAEDYSTVAATELTFIRHSDPRLIRYQALGHMLTNEHPLRRLNPLLSPSTALSLDDEVSLMTGVRKVKEGGKKGIMLAVPEEGAAAHPELVRACTRVLYVVHPAKLATTSQRGLNAALSTAVALERLRTCIDNL